MQFVIFVIILLTCHISNSACSEENDDDSSSEEKQYRSIWGFSVNEFKKKNHSKRNSSKVPKCDETNQICENVPDYPENLIREVLSNNDNNEISKFFIGLKRPAFGIRGGSLDEAGYKTMCRTKTKLYYPQKMVNPRGLERFVVNHNGNFQPVQTETCWSDEGELNSENGMMCSLHKHFPENYTSRCRQLFTHKHLIVLDKENGTLVPDEFDIPCACVCVYKE